jgi:hypothetical protein
VREEATSDDRVARGVELEQEELAGLEHTEATIPARLPEVQLLEIGAARQESNCLAKSSAGGPGLQPW